MISKRFLEECLDWEHLRPLLVAANKQDLPDALSPAALREFLDVPAEVKILPCVATDRDSVKAVLEELVVMHRARLAERAGE